MSRQMTYFDEYQLEAAKFAIYDADYQIIYPTLGVVNEWLEFVIGYETAEPDSIVLELGDILWYFAAIATDLRLPLGTLAEVRPIPTCPFDQFEVHLCKLLGLVKKWMRGDYPRLPDELIAEQMRAALSCLIAICQSEGITIYDVAKRNLEKLSGRAARDTIRGDGDIR